MTTMSRDDIDEDRDLFIKMHRLEKPSFRIDKQASLYVTVGKRYASLQSKFIDNSMS